MKRPKLYAFGFVALVILVGWFDLSGQASDARAATRAAQHETQLVRSDAQVATELANQGVTGIGMPNALREVVPFTVQAGCTVGMSLASSHGSATLYLSIRTATGKSRKVDTVTDGASAAAVRANILTLGLCK